MFLRLLFLLTLCLGLATGPVRAVGGCPAQAMEMKCGDCCGEKAVGCCAKSHVPADQAPPLATTSVDLKRAIVPTLIYLGIQPCLVVLPASIRQRAFAQQPVQRRLDVTCIRLI